MKIKAFLLTLLIPLGPLSGYSQATINAPKDEFQPLPRLTVQTSNDQNAIYVVSPSGRAVLSPHFQPNYMVSNGKITPYKSVARPTVMTNSPSTDKPVSIKPMLPAAADKEFQASVQALLDLKKKEPGRILRLQKLITEANQQPEVQKRLQEVQKAVHDYISKKSPEDLEALEKMEKPKEIMEHNGVPGNLVY